MQFTVWPYTQRLVDRMADSALQDHGVSLTPRPPRSPGLHASTLLKLLHPTESTITEAELRIYGLLGLAFEDRAELALLTLSQEPDWPWDCYRPGEVEADGIACSPDILLIPKGDGPLMELSLKVTWKSTREAPEGPKFQYYADQSLTYSTPLQTLNGVLLVYFVNGDYGHLAKGQKGKGRPPVPLIKGWQMAWSEQERAETWQALYNLRDE
jgi:hypothetical protein